MSQSKEVEIKQWRGVESQLIFSMDKIKSMSQTCLSFLKAIGVDTDNGKRVEHDKRELENGLFMFIEQERGDRRNIKALRQFSNFIWEQSEFTCVGARTKDGGLASFGSMIVPLVLPLGSKDNLDNKKYRKCFVVVTPFFEVPVEQENLNLISIVDVNVCLMKVSVRIADGKFEGTEAVSGIMGSSQEDESLSKVDYLKNMEKWGEALENWFVPFESVCSENELLFFDTSIFDAPTEKITLN